MKQILFKNKHGILVGKKMLPILFFGVILGWVIWQVQPPQTLTSASFWQLAIFFIPLFALLTFSLNLYFHFYLKSALTSLGIILLLILKSLNILNILSLTLTLFIILFLLKLIKRPLWKTKSIRQKGVLNPRINLPQANPKQADLTPDIPKLKRL